jgi:glutamate-ammonia-ligase adenylyltransferase
MTATGRGFREGIVERAAENSPFIRDCNAALPDVAAAFASDGAAASISAAQSIGDEEVAVALRLRRRALALAVALGDLAGELGLERLTATLSDFADEAIHAALVAALEERVPGAGTDGFTVLALGKLGPPTST